MLSLIMSGKKPRHAVSSERLPAEEDKENKKVYANLKFNNLNKNLEDAHLFKLSKKNLLTERNKDSDQERDSRTTLSRSYRNLGKNQTTILMELLKEEIEKKYLESKTNKQYRFPGGCKNLDESDDSLQSLEEAEAYNLYSQNQSDKVGSQEIESLLSRLVTIVNKTPHAGSLLNQKNTNSHRLFCQLLQNVASDKDQAPVRLSRQKKPKEKSTAKLENSKTVLAKSTGGQMIGKLQLKSKQELAGTLKTNRTETSPPLKVNLSRGQGLKSFARDNSKRQRSPNDLIRSGSGRLMEKRADNPVKMRPVKKQVKTITTTSFGNSGLKASSISKSRRQSPEDSSMAKLQAQGPGFRSFAKFTKNIGTSSKLWGPPTGHLL